MPNPTHVCGIDPSPTGAAYALLDGDTLSSAGPYVGHWTDIDPCACVYIVERIVPMGRPVGHDIFSSLENGLHIAEMAHWRGSLVYYVPCGVMRRQLWSAKPIPKENEDSRIVRELGLRGYLQYGFKERTSAIYVTEPKCLSTNHARDALVYALFNYRSAENQQHRFPDCLGITL